MKIIVSDMGGVLYSFDKSFDPIKHENNFEVAINKLGMGNKDTKEQLLGEWISVKGGELRIYPNRRNVKNILKCLEKDYKLVIASTSLVETSELILKKIGLGQKAWKIFDMSNFGSKKDKESWKKMFSKIPRVNIIVEDSQENLTSAKKAANELGFNPEAFTFIPTIESDKSS